MMRMRERKPLVGYLEVDADILAKIKSWQICNHSSVDLRIAVKMRERERERERKRERERESSHKVLWIK